MSSLDNEIFKIKNKLKKLEQKKVELNKRKMILNAPNSIDKLKGLCNISDKYLDRRLTMNSAETYRDVFNEYLIKDKYYEEIAIAHYSSNDSIKCILSILQDMNERLTKLETIKSDFNPFS